MTRPVRVAHVITKLAIGGAQESALNTCIDLPRSQFEQILLTGAETDDEGDLFAEAAAAGIDVRVVPSLQRRIRPGKDLAAVRCLAAELRRWRPDVVHTHSSKAGIVGRVAGRLAGAQVVVHSVHGWSFNEALSGSTRAAVVWAERLAARWTDALVVESSTDLPKGQRLGIGRGRDYALIRNGIDLSRFPADVERAAVRSSIGVPEDAWVVGTVGRLAEQKDPLLMVDAFERMRASRPDARFVWIGDGPLRGEVEARIAAGGLGDSFLLLGVRRDVPELLAALDAFALSSRWEGLPRTVTEAMASGLPVVSTAVDGVVEAVENDRTGILVTPNDAQRLAEGMARLADAPTEAARMGAAGRARSAMFDRRSMAGDVAELYRELLAGRGVPAMRRPRRVLHVITGLGFGGAERQLQLLVRQSDPSELVHEVVSLTSGGPIADELREEGVAVTELRLRGGLAAIIDLVRLRRIVARSGADVLQTWLYHADVLGGLAGRSAGIPVVWNVRMTWMDPTRTKRSTMWAARVGAALSRWVPARIIFNSEEGEASHARHGYETGRSVVVPNALDRSRFRPDPAAAAALREQLDLPGDAQLVGAVARNDPQKGHEDLLAAFAEVAGSWPRAVLLLVGAGCTSGTPPFDHLVDELDLDGRVRLLGPRDDVERITAGLDVAVSASRYGESCSNVIAEARACGVPVVTTDVGAARSLVGDGGVVVAPGDRSGLAAAMELVLAGGVAAPTASAGPDTSLADRYLDVYHDVLGR